MDMFKLSITGLLFACAPAYAGPEWVEQGDAGSLPGGAQIVAGSGSLGKISGALQGALTLDGAADFVDMYLIYIDDPQNFSATTTFLGGGNAQFDSQLWLFKVDGLGLLGNDDTFIPSPLVDSDGKIVSGSTLGPAATDQTGQMITDPGMYLLAISNQFMVPASPGGLICLFASSIEISGPDGQGGTQPISFWQNTSLESGNPSSGTYSIGLTGTSLVPGPSGAVALLIGLIGLRGRARRQ
jgi:hypothetical protein